MALHYKKAIFDDATLPLVLELMGSCFPHATKFTRTYLQWLYNENPEGPPVGYHLFEDGLLVGQLIGLPQRVMLRQSPARLILLLDVAVHPNQRGRGHFLDLTKRTRDLAASQGFSAVIGVANQNTYRGYPKIGFQDVGSLAARVSLLSMVRLQADRAIERAELYRDWSDDSLDWRLRNPNNPLRVVDISTDAIVIDGNAPYSGLRARGVIPRRWLRARTTEGAMLRPCLMIGLEPDGTCRHPLSIAIPDRFKPSPLRLIYYDLHDAARRIDPASVLFSFLDFDIL